MQAMLVIACRLGVILAAAVLLPLLAVCGLPQSAGQLSRAISSWTIAGSDSTTRLLAQPFEMPGETLRYRSGPLPVGLAPHDAVTQVAFHESPAVGDATQSSDPAQRRALDRLRDLGATFYRLRPWGADAGLFRFETQIALDGDTALQRYFDAVDPDPLAAVEHVLAEVEAWRAHRVR